VLPSFCICETRGLEVGLAHESLISNPHESRAPVAPTLTECSSRPMVGNCTLRGSGFFEPRARAARGSSLLCKGPVHFTPAVAATVMRGGRAFSGAAALRLPRCNDRVRARAPGHFGRGRPCLSVTGAVHLQLMRVECAIRGPWIHGSINTRGGVGDPLPQHLAPIAPAFFAFRPRASRAPSPSPSVHFVSTPLRRSAWLPSSPSP
jgi:hypothetical protein